jgi:hypothetical protein
MLNIDYGKPMANLNIEFRNDRLFNNMELYYKRVIRMLIRGNRSSAEFNTLSRFFLFCEL